MVTHCRCSLLEMITINYLPLMYKLPAAPIAVFCFIVLY